MKKFFKEACHAEPLQTNFLHKRVFKYYHQPVLDLNQTTLKRQSVKRIHVTKCQFDSISPENHFESRIVTLAIKSLKRIKSRKIAFSFDWRIETELYLFIESLKINHLLRSLNLNFNGSQLSNESLFFLSKILKKIHFVNKLNLNFFDCYYLKDEGLYRVSQGLKNLINLQTMSLKFGGCHHIMNAGLGYIGKVLYPSLENVELDFLSVKLMR